MNRLLLLGSVIILLLLLFVPSAGAANITLHYYESIDVVVRDSRFQLFSVLALQGEDVTIAAYGLEEDMVLSITCFDTEGRTLSENLNAANDAVVATSFTASTNGLYTFLVSKKTDTGSMMRIMMFEGDAFEADVSFLDTIDPLLPSRAYLIAGDSEETSVAMQIQVLDDGNDTTPLPEIFAARSTDVTIPPYEERIAPLHIFNWANDQGATFYTLNVRAIPEISPTSRLIQSKFARRDIENPETVRIDLGNGSDNPQYIPRFICQITAVGGLNRFSGPAIDLSLGQPLPAGSSVEVLGENGDFYLIADSDQDTGGSWVPKQQLTVDVSNPNCSRVAIVSSTVLPDELSPSGVGGGSVPAP